jgi:hypothetical protein
MISCFASKEKEVIKMKMKRFGILSEQVQYVKDCQALFGRLLDGHMMFSRGEEDDREAVDFTRDLWNSRYPGEEYDLCRSSGAGCVRGSRRKISYNLEAAIARQSSFYYQVRLG